MTHHYIVVYSRRFRTILASVTDGSNYSPNGGIKRSVILSTAITPLQARLSESLHMGGKREEIDYSSNCGSELQILNQTLLPLISLPEYQQLN